MTAFSSTLSRPVTAKRSEVLLRLPGALYQAIARYFAQRAAIARLREFDDSELRDIGLTRSQIEPAVRGLGTTAPLVWRRSGGPGRADSPRRRRGRRERPTAGPWRPANEELE